MTNKIAVIVRVEPDVSKWLKRISYEQNVSINKIINGWIEKNMKKYIDKKHQHDIM